MMLSIYKRELKGYFATYTGYIFLTFMLLATGIYSWFVNFKNQSPNFEYVIYNLNFLFLIIVPILTMRIFADERRQKTDKLLYSLPLKSSWIVLGKYLSAVTVLFFGCVLVACIPLTLSFFGKISLVTCFSTLFGYFLLGATLIAIGTFISSLCENPVISAISSFLVFLLSYLSSTVATAFTASETALSFVSSLALFDRLILFVTGIFDLTSVLYYISIAVLFVFLTVLSVDNKRGLIIKSVFSVAAVIVVAVVNIASTFIPTTFTHFDTTSDDLFTLTDWTKEKINMLDKKVDIYYLCLNDIEDENIAELLTKYEALSDNITVTVKNTATDPYFYASYTEAEPSDNSLIVASGEKSYCIDYYDIYEFSDTSTNFDGEGEITAAIDYVTSESSPILYTLEGHEEAEFSDELSGYIKKENIEVRTLNLTSLTAVPDDAACVVINSPQRDLSEDAKALLSAYMKKGGKLLILRDYTQQSLPVFDSLLADYGLTVEKGIVQEQNSNLHYPGQPFTIIPVVLPHAVTDPLIDAELSVIFPFAGGITMNAEDNSTLSIEAFIATEETAYSTVNLSETTREKAEGDVSGPFALGVEVTDHSVEQPSTLILYSTSLFLSSNANDLVGGANLDLFLNTVSYMCEAEAQTTLRSKVLMTNSITVSELASNISFTVLVVLLPLATVLLAISVVYRRRYR